jgi:hypothetical protein
VPVGRIGIGTTIIGGTASAGIAPATAGPIPCHTGIVAKRSAPDANLRLWFAICSGNGAQGRNRTLTYPTESPSFFE